MDLTDVVLASLFIVAAFGCLFWWDYNRIKDTPEFRDIVEEIEREDRLKEFRNNK